MKPPADKVDRRLVYGRKVERTWPEREDLHRPGSPGTEGQDGDEYPEDRPT